MLCLNLFCFADLLKHLLQTSCLHRFLLTFALQRDDMTTQFNQMSLSRQSSGDNPESPSGPVYPSPILQQPAQQTGYIMASPTQQLPPGGFTGSGPPVSQQVLQPPPPPQGFVQQSAEYSCLLCYLLFFLLPVWHGAHCKIRKTILKNILQVLVFYFDIFFLLW